ncbi:MAG: prolyl aminopeptidase [Chlamydiia bacterium]|nr:prolyl aminopeptidase [Chlamydiia bacterium]
MKTKYPPIEPYCTGYLDVGSGHSLYWEESGRPDGLPALFLHGGPGSGTEPSHRCYFDPTVYRIVLMDQRGAGKSRPHANLDNNTTWDLVEDLECLREHLHIERWLVFGGSWGSTLALAYAETHPKRVRALIVRGIFLARKKEIDWFYQFGAHHIFTDAWEKFLELIPVHERKDLVSAYYARLTAKDQAIRQEAAKAWSGWEAATLKLIFDPALYQHFTRNEHADALARIECHYFLNRSFFKTDNWLIEHASALAPVPGVIIQGRYDIICPFESAWELHKAWPEAKFEIIPDAGHAASEPGITDALIRATDLFAKL